jgi:tetratricopeptide (TPR) repeat protein
MTIRARLVSALVAIASVLYAAEGRAAPEGELDAARKLFFEAVDAQDKGHYEEALGLYIRAGSVAVSPTLLFNVGNCHESLGQLIEAQEAFSRALGEARAQGDAEVEREALARVVALQQQIPRVVVRLAPGTAEVSATLDDRPLGDEELASLRANPGTHQLLVRSEEHPRVFQSVIDLKERSTRVVEVDLGPKGRPPSSATLTSPAPLIRHSYVPALVAGGSALVLGFGAVLAGLQGNEKLQRFNDANAAPTDENRAGRVADREDGQAAFAVNALLTGAAVLATVAAVYLFVRPPHAAPPGRAASFR